MKRIFVVCCALFLIPVPLASKKRVASPYTIVINDNGFSTLSLGATLLTPVDKLQLIDGSWFYLPFDSRSFYPAIPTKSSSTSGNTTTVNHTYSGVLSATAVYTYVVTDGYISIQAQITNTSGSEITIPGFSSPHFLWDNWPAGVTQMGLGTDFTQTQSAGVSLSYPSSNVRLASAYGTGLAAGQQLNFGIWSKEDPFSKFMIIPYTRGGETGKALAIIFFDPIPAAGTKTFNFAFRFDSSMDWKVLLQGYKNDVRTVFPTVTYETDARPVAQFARIDVSHVRPDNPYGYDDGGTNLKSRFDKLAGCQDYISTVVPLLLSANYQGIIFWQPQGINPRGVQYRPDFDIFPAETYPNLPTLFGGFTSVGMSVGLLARPGQEIVATSPTTDGLLPFATLQDAIDDIEPRIAWALGQGVSKFYIDSFVNTELRLYDHNLMQAIRQAVGNGGTFCEFSTVLSMAFSSVYAELIYQSGKFILNPQIPFLRWIFPEAVIITKFNGALPPGGYTEVYAYMFSNKLTPLVGDDRIISTTDNAIIQPLVQQYIDANNHWRTVREKASGRQKLVIARQLDIAPRGIASNRQTYDTSQ